MEREERLERVESATAEPATPPKDLFNEIDFGSYFQDYLDPGYRTQPEYEESEKPSFENFLSQPTTLSDHLAWQLGALSLDFNLAQAAEFVVGNLDDDGYLTASDEELAEALRQFPGCHLDECSRPLMWSDAPSTWCSILIRPAWRARSARVPADPDRGAAGRVCPFLLAPRLRTGGRRRRSSSQFPGRGRSRSSRSGGARWKWRR